MTRQPSGYQKAGVVTRQRLPHGSSHRAQITVVVPDAAAIKGAEEASEARREAGAAAALGFDAHAQSG